MSGLKEFDDNLGHCCYCSKQVSKSEDWVIPWPPVEYMGIAHRTCQEEVTRKASEI